MGDVFDDDRYCFVCGEKNPFGLQLVPRGSNGKGHILWTPKKRHQGYSGVVHGGLISTILDEAMAYAAMSIVGFCATAGISVKFRSPVKVDIPVRVEAEVVERRGRIVKLQAHLYQDEEEKASGNATFISVPGERRKE
ncbi:MAG: PaaI family thioesterase [Candidatus Aegiribacteria sp.]|nr:PaaI family thioesterase [Candidatus Aegiribacteria sp.]MBD3294755.1 PaaI family thioesterase [Candidatus Fermentibacteria bacterium]